MNLPRLAVNRPVAVLMSILAAMLLGMVALTRLPIDLLPELNLPYAAVITNYQGAGPEEVEKSISKPLEEALGTVHGIKNIRSMSMMGTSVLVLEFEWGTNMDFATLEMRERIDRVQGFLPDGADKPMVVKMDPNMMPVMTLALYGDKDEARLKDLAENIVKKRLERLEGVAAVSVTGGFKREIQVLVYPERLNFFGLSLAQVVQTLAGENTTFAAGKVEDAGKNVLVRVTGEFKSLEEIERIGFPTSGGGIVRLKDIAKVEDTHAERTSLALLDGRPAIGLSIQKQAGANTVAISREVKKAISEMASSLPPGVKVEPIVDNAKYIEAAIQGIYRDMLWGSLLAMALILLFLRNFKSTLVIGLTIPVSVITTFVLLYFDRLNLNLITLGGLSLGIGRMVDDAIVVFDNIYRHRQLGEEPVQAAISGTGEVANAVVASTLTTIGVFLPVAFVQGLASQLFTPMAFTVALSLLASLAVSLTVTPMLAARILAGELPKEERTGRGLWQVLWSGSWLTSLTSFYKRALQWSLNHRPAVILFTLAIFTGGLALIPAVGVEFFPASDEGTINISLELPKGTLLSETSRVAERIVEIIKGEPEVKSIYEVVGGSTSQMSILSGETPEIASITVRLVDRSERRRSSEEVASALRRKLRQIPGAKITVTAASGFESGGLTQAPVQVDIHGDDLFTLKELALQVKQIVSQVPGTVGVESSFTQGRPQVEVIVDREKAALYNLSSAQVGNIVASAVGGKVATRYRVGGEEYDVRVQLPLSSRRTLMDLENLTVPSPLGIQVPLKEVARFKIDTTPSTINRYNQERVASVTANISGRPLGDVIQDIRRGLSELKLPPGYRFEFTGQNKMMLESFGQLGMALVMAILLVYMIMAAQFESLFHPFIIMFSIPISLTGVVLALLLTRRTFSVTAFLGVIMLAGVVLSNAIVLVDYINLLRRRGLPREEAILQAGATRLRPILLTAFTTILAMLPLAVGLGEGAEMQAPLATAVSGGLLVSTLLTLVFIPVLYTLLEDLGIRLFCRFKVSKGMGA
ncbi:hydrophobic/amphiphilic exporter-1, HAE1 family [Thermanaeromonas toyohensis ToBE]|uniref:Hydrophobic/amphiphilic exporter-1, HAE1 family n=1 Tax=Thermanaeromonas toyohensis ToBE TaxID=698762 RepID=A0A1W1V8V1_9FIRM|nr:efflux RND transporter permease subunit [Thermanaeromonas toyohensis]SMB89869.1 hydrophobic/amphiphilic exporter-1, HAE1 family [Thermanaeromonas toyohensis ToBE]